jgi:hypothetical protein
LDLLIARFPWMTPYRTPLRMRSCEYGSSGGIALARSLPHGNELHKSRHFPEVSKLLQMFQETQQKPRMRFLPMPHSSLEALIEMHRFWARTVIRDKFGNNVK